MIRISTAVVVIPVAIAAVLDASNQSETDPSSGMFLHTTALGDLEVIVTEGGTLENFSSTYVKCRSKWGSTVLKITETGMDRRVR